MNAQSGSSRRQTSASLVYHFPGTREARIADVGGKALSLIELRNAGLPVPPGFVLSTAFFKSWFDRIKSSTAWQHFLTCPQTEQSSACQALKEEATQLMLDELQKAELDRALQRLDTATLFAVRSSSPEEDLEGASFAGVYATILGVTGDRLQESINQAFTSCLDHRIVVYKAERGFDIYDPRIAVIVQAQIASEIAGVGFSINPVTNDFDEAVINASWGLGESVVAGQITPDTYVVDKHSLTLKERNVGTKASAIWLLPEGGTEKREAQTSDAPALSDDQAVELTQLISAVEQHFGKPMDIEWAIAGGSIFLLQGRPITAYVPIAPEMLTEPGAPRRLYLDATISAQGIFKPLSPMGTSVIRTFLSQFYQRAFGHDYSSNVDTTLPYVRHGRIYLVVSNAFSLVGKDKLVRALANIDPIAAEAIRQAPDDVRSGDRRSLAKLEQALIAFGLARIPFVLQAIFLPERVKQRLRVVLAQHIDELTAFSGREVPARQMAVEIFEKTRHLVVRNLAPLIALSKALAPTRLRSLFAESSRKLVACLDRSTPNNVTIGMGLELDELARLLPKGISLAQLEDGIISRNLPASFLEGWQHFLERYGHRGPGELDIASERYRDDPRLLLEQLVQVRNAPDDAESALDRFRRSERERLAAYEQLRMEARGASWLRWKEFELLYRVVENFAGLRETPKFHLVLALSALRRDLIRQAEKLVREGRLDAIEQIFDLTLDDLDDAVENPSVDLRQRAKLNRSFSDRLARVPELPRVFDSRGRILRPRPRPAAPGESAGTPVSPGVARGPAKVLHSWDEKPLLRGEVLVAKATDPGWTPLFVNARAVVLEVGGMLQHGALVAREYGIPCVTGILDATEQWQDGTLIEVDGNAGIVRTVTGE